MKTSLSFLHLVSLQLRYIRMYVWIVGGIEWGGGGGGAFYDLHDDTKFLSIS